MHIIGTCTPKRRKFRGLHMYNISFFIILFRYFVFYLVFNDYCKKTRRFGLSVTANLIARCEREKLVIKRYMNFFQVTCRSKNM